MAENPIRIAASNQRAGHAEHLLGGAGPALEADHLSDDEQW
ncbi:MAG: hypothetical protein WCB57_02215 [Pseudonocardiaceae bacterium]